MSRTSSAKQISTDAHRPSRRLREALTGDKTAIQITDAAYTEPVNAFNARLLEYGNALWKKHFLAPTPPEEEETSHGLSVVQLEQIRLYAEGRDQSVAGALGLTTHAGFSSLATQFLKVRRLSCAPSCARKLILTRVRLML